MKGDEKCRKLGGLGVRDDPRSPQFHYLIERLRHPIQL